MKATINLIDMQIRRIKSVKKYKSFIDFSWDNFCKDCKGNDQIISNFSVIFGENGSGKSSICDILKNLSQIQEFQEIKPELAEIEIKNSKDEIYKFENGAWSPNKIDKNSFLFFDVDFINANVHTHGDRSNQQGRHSQNSGKMIIDLDEQANQLKKEIKEKREELEYFEKVNYVVLNRNFLAEDIRFFSSYKDKSQQEINDESTQKQKEVIDIESSLTSLHKINKKYSEIKQLAAISLLPINLSLSKKEIYSELFSRQLKERAQDQADEKIKEHFNKHKRFIEIAKNEIPDNYRDENCPLCMQPLNNASEVIGYYRKAFDRTYEDEKSRFLTDLQKLKSELEYLKLNITSVSTKIVNVFNSLERTKTDFDIDVYKIDEKEKYVKNFEGISNIPEIDQLISAINLLGHIDRKNIGFSDNYDKLIEILGAIKKQIDDFNNLVKNKNEKIQSFKDSYSDQGKIINEIQEKTQKQTEIKELISFLISDKIEIFKDKIDKATQKNKLSTEFKRIQEELKNHLANTIPESVITKMINILEKFNLNFTLEHIKPAPNTKDYSFSFKIKDNKGHERNFKDGLSEGERQLISLAFFFAINENLPNKENTILIFDDPITSLDSPNLKILADLIHTKTQVFSQVIIFTHHPLFYKYLCKCQNPNPCKYGILKNHEDFGGSFVFHDPGFDLIEEVQKCNEEIKQNAGTGNLKPEEIALRYGQLLRLAVEKFIKHELLMWNKESNFEQEIIANLSKSRSKIQKLDDSDLEIMMNIHKYCNHSNLLHADKENPSALSELVTHIDKFTTIQDKVKI